MKQRKDTNTVQKTVYQRYTQKPVLFRIAKYTLICLQNTDQRCVILDIQIVLIGHIFFSLNIHFMDKDLVIFKKIQIEREMCV